MRITGHPTVRYPLVLLAVLAITLPAAAGKQPFVQGDDLPFEFRDLDGAWVSSADERFDGKVVFVDLWGTWCPPCVGEIPTLVDLQHRFEDDGLVIVAIAFESEDEETELRRERLRSFVEQNGINYLVLDGRAPRAESPQVIAGLENVRGFPVEILFDRDGRLVDVRNGFGYSRRWARKLERELIELLTPPTER